MFLKKLKDMIIVLARNAVFTAEEEIGSGKGEIKKKLAIDYIVSNLPFPTFVKDIIGTFLSHFIDDAIETAVEYMHSLSKTQGDK